MLSSRYVSTSNILIFSFLSGIIIIQIALSKHYGVTTVVVGGKEGTVQQYTGTVGGQSSDFSTMDTEVKVRDARKLFPRVEWY